MYKYIYTINLIEEKKGRGNSGKRGYMWSFAVYGFFAVKIFQRAELWNSSNSSRASAHTWSYSCWDTLISEHHQRFIDLNKALICSLYR